MKPPLRVFCLSLCLAWLAPIGASAQVTLGDPIVNRPTDDGSQNQVYIYVGGTFGTVSTASTWSFFDNESFGNMFVTPLLFERVSATNYVLRGVGTTQTTTSAGSQTGLAFGLIAGSAAIAANYTFGFTDRALSYPGSGNNLTTGTINAGVVDRDTGTTWARSAESSFNIVIGQSYILGGSTAGDFSTVAMSSTVDRIYSAQLTTSAVPEPARTTAGLGLAALAALGLWRRSRRGGS